MGLRICFGAVLIALTGGAQTESAADPLLARIRQKATEMLAGIPNYTCVETINRASRPQRYGEFQNVDRIYLEVAQAGGKELFSRPGARKFEEKHPSEFAASGAVGSGDFALYARSVFLNSGTRFRAGSTHDVDGVPSIRYDYEVSPADSGYIVAHGSTSARVPFHGSFFVDAETLDLLRLDVIADRIPAQVGIGSLSTQIDYARFRIGGDVFVLPQSSMTLAIYSSGMEHRNQSEFTHCRQYSGRATISFEDAPVATGPAPLETNIPSSLRFNLVLATGPALASSKTGDPIVATVTTSVASTGEILVPAGAEVTGRLRSLRKSADRFFVTLEFSEIRWPQGHARFFAELRRARLQHGKVEILGSTAAPGVATLLIAAKTKLSETMLEMLWNSEALNDVKQLPPRGQ